MHMCVRWGSNNVVSIGICFLILYARLTSKLLKYNPFIGWELFENLEFSKTLLIFLLNQTFYDSEDTLSILQYL